MVWRVTNYLHPSPESHCRVCGYEDTDLPYGEDGKTPSFNFCPCCGVEHGYQDCEPIAARKYREAWIQSGAKWELAAEKPEEWILQEQLKNIPKAYR